MIAVGLSLLAILYQASRPYLAVLGRIPGDPPVYADMDRHASAEPVKDVLILRPNVPLTFVNADVAEDQVKSLVAGRPSPPLALVLDIGATADLDVATTDMLSTLSVELGDRGIEFRLAQVRGSGARPDAPDRVDGDHRGRALLPSVEAALAAPLPDVPAV